MEIKRLNEERIDGKQYLFRGESRNNYRNKAKTELNSRYFAYEVFEGIGVWGRVAVYELLDDSNILDYDDSVEEFVEEYNLLDVKSPLLKKLYGVESLSELDDGRDYHDIYHARQIIATEYLEKQTNYDGCVWYEWSDTPEYQVQIWNMNIVRRLPYKEAKEVINKLAETAPDRYSDEVRNDFWSKYNYELKR